jgi:succinyl-diaminopimelate desuccinylase
MTEVQHNESSTEVRVSTSLGEETRASSGTSRHDVQIDMAEVVSFTAQLVRIRSVYEAGVSSEQGAADLVVAKMREWGWEPDVVEVAPGRPNVIVTVSGGHPGPVLGFEGHLDVVTEGERSDWTFDPFGAEIVDGRLYGRGAADMKSGVAAMLYATRAMQLSGPFPGSVRLFVLSDEEGGMLGAKFAVASGELEGVSGVIICEPEGDEVCPTSKGAIRLRLDLVGKMSHGAMPELGRNPLPVLGKVLTALETVQHELQDRHGSDEHLGDVYVTPTAVEGGTAVQMNTIPQRASVWVDIRTIPGVDHAALIERITRDCTKIGNDADIVVTVGVLDDRPPVNTSVDDPIVRCLLDAHHKITGVQPAFGGVPGTTDGTIFTRDASVPTVVYGPGGKWIAHQADEFVSVESIARYALTYAEAALTFLEGPMF